MEPNRLTGVIKTMWPSKGSGLITIPTDKQEFYFDLAHIQTEHTGIGSQVTFLTAPNPGRTRLRAVDIRKAA